MRATVGRTSWWDQGTGVAPTQPLTLTLTPTRTRNRPEMGEKRGCAVFRYFFNIPIFGPPHGPRPMIERENYPPRSACGHIVRSAVRTTPSCHYGQTGVSQPRRNFLADSYKYRRVEIPVQDGEHAHRQFQSRQPIIPAL